MAQGERRSGQAQGNGKYKIPGRMTAREIRAAFFELRAMQAEERRQRSQDDGGEEEEQKRKRPPPVFRRTSALPSRLARSGSPLAQARPLQLPPPILRLSPLPAPPVPEHYAPTRPANCETIQQTRSRLYQHHKRNGTLAVFYQMYPGG